MKINIINENHSSKLSVILDETAELIKDNHKEASVEKSLTSIDNTKGEILINILVTLGTTIAADMVVFFITEAIRRHMDQKKKKIQIIKEKKLDTDHLEIMLEDNDSEIIIKIEEQ